MKRTERFRCTACPGSDEESGGAATRDEVAEGVWPRECRCCGRRDDWRYLA